MGSTQPDAESGDNASSATTPIIIGTKCLIVGAGPAGAALGCFLGQNGVEAIMISKMPGTVVTPRSHVLNPAAMECLRDIGLEEDLQRAGYSNYHQAHYRFCESMAGREYGRNLGFDNHPSGQENLYEATPCKRIDLTQVYLEPYLVKYASQHGISIRWEHELRDFRELPDGTIESQVFDRLSKQTLLIRSKYLFGADGGRSLVVDKLSLPMTVPPGGGGGLAINVEFDADMGHFMKHSPGLIHHVLQPHLEFPRLGPQCLMRMIRPWDKWIAILFPDPEYGKEWTASEEELLERVNLLIGDPSVTPKITNVSRWFVNEIVADKYTNDHNTIFCLGDAVHRHPPHNGLGGNTSMQDAYNLAWKIAYVEQGLAGPELLTTYNRERQPVGAGIVKRSNDAIRSNFAMAGALGMFEPDLVKRIEMIKLFGQASEDGQAKRDEFEAMLESNLLEIRGLGIEMNQRYFTNFDENHEKTAAAAATSKKSNTGGGGIYLADEPIHPNSSTRPVPRIEPPGEITFHTISSYPGCRLPHAWLNKPIPTTEISTQDLAGHGHFTILTGIGGKQAWTAAATKASAALSSSSSTFDLATTSSHKKIEIKVYSIGWNQDWEDCRRMWKKYRAVSETGAVLVRPDRFVAWRCWSLPASLPASSDEGGGGKEDGKETEEEEADRGMGEKLLEVLKAVLWR